MASVDPKVFRAYDIRALVPDLVDETSVYYGKVGAADAYQAPLTPEGVEQLARGLARQGVDVLDIGVATTDMVYYASCKWKLPAVEITASHWTKELKGMK